MRPATRNLPSLAQPWGRYIEEQIDQSHRNLDAYERDARALSAANGGIMDRQASQVRQIDGASMVVVTVEPFSRVIASIPVGGTPQYAYSPIVSAPMPSGGTANSCRLIVNFDVNDNTDTTIADRGELFLRMNSQYSKDPRTWGPGGSGLLPYVGARSSMMLSTEQTTNYEAQFCMRIASYSVSGIVTFSNVRFTYIFYGAI